MNMKKKLFITSALTSALIMSGCSTVTQDQATISQEQHEKQLAEQRATYEQKLQALETSNTQYSALAQSNSGSGSDISSELFPPNAQPGQCWSKVLTPATYQTSTEQLLLKPASEKISITPATYETVTEQLLVKEESTEIVVIPATYKMAEEQVMVKPAHTTLRTIPAVYENVTEQVLEKAAHTVWKRGDGFKTNALQTRIDNGTGEIMCLVEVPASYRTVTKRVLVTPEQVVESVEPAIYKTVSKRVIDQPASTKTVTIPAEYRTVSVQRLVSPEQQFTTPIAAVYKDVTSSVKVTEESLKWAEVLCEDNMTSQTVASLQKLLQESGTYNGPIDGSYGPMTEQAANTYAKQNGLPTGSRLISLETAKHIGLDI